jgi:hypothetical protein
MSKGPEIPPSDVLRRRADGFNKPDQGQTSVAIAKIAAILDGQSGPDESLKREIERVYDQHNPPSVDPTPATASNSGGEKSMGHGDTSADTTAFTFLDYCGLGLILMPIEAVGQRWIDEHPINRHTLVAAGTAMLVGAVVLGISKRIKGQSIKPRGLLFQDFVALANKAWFWAVVAAAIIFGVPFTVSYVSPSVPIPIQAPSPFNEATAKPPAPRSKQAINELLDESGSILSVIEKSGLPLANEWRESITTQNPERICLDIDSRTLQDKITALANKLDAAHRDISNIYEKNRIDQAEFNKVFGSPMVGVGLAGFAAAAQPLRQYAHEINLLGEHPTCEALIRVGNIPTMFVNMSRGLDQFSIWVAQSQENLSRYRDNLRKELRNVP